MIKFCINKIKLNINFFYEINEETQKIIILNSTMNVIQSFAHFIELEKISPCIIIVSFNTLVEKIVTA